MADNTARYGLRYYSNFSQSGPPPHQEFRISSGYAPAFTGPTACSLEIGDAVALEPNDGTIKLFDDPTAAPSTSIYGVVVGFGNMKLGPEGKARPASFYPQGGVTYSGDELETRVTVVPLLNTVWEIDVNGTTIGSTKAAYEAAIGANFELLNVGDTSISGRTRANPRLDSTSAATTAGLPLRVVGVSKTTLNVDFSGNFVKLLVMANAAALPQFTLTGELT